MELGCEEKQLRDEKNKMSLSSQLRKLELVRVNECEQVDGAGVRLQGLISCAAL